MTTPNIPIIKPDTTLALAVKARETLFTETGYMLYAKPRNIGKLKGWLADKLWALLGRMGCQMPHMVSYDRFTYTRKVCADVTEVVYRIMDDEVFRRPEDYVLLMGHRQWQDIASDKRLFSEFGLKLDPYSYTDSRTYLDHPITTHYSGMVVHVVDHVDGIVAVPKLIIMERRRAK